MKAPAFQFYPKDLESDEAWKMMSYEERGIFITLLCHQWTNGSIPSGQTVLARLLRLDTDKVAQIWPSLARHFESHREGRLVNPDLAKQRQKIAKRRSLPRDVYFRRRIRRIPKELRDELLSETAFCAQCGNEESLELDHIIPVAHGGRNEKENLQVLCASCNRSKGSRIQ